MGKRFSLLARICFAVFAFAILAQNSLIASEPPTIPIGLDAYRQWDKWPYQRIGARSYMRSTYDRRGGNEGADASHFLYQLSDSNNVALEVQGAGVLYFARYNHWHGSPWHYEVDGTDRMVQETSTATPNKPVDGSTFLPAELFPSPLACTWADTKGADLTWVPIPFERSFRMGYSRTHYGTGYYIYQQYAGGAKLSRPIHAWDGKSPPDPDVLALIARAGTDLSPPGAPEKSGMIKTLAKGKVESVLVLKGASMVRKLSFTISREQAILFGRARLRITWDGRREASVDAPIALFFGAGTLYNRDDREYLVKAFPSFIRFDPQNVELTCLFPMPFFKSARFELIGAADTPIRNVSWKIRSEAFNDSPDQVGYFHATYRDHPNPEPGQDLILLDTRKVEGGGDWSGNFAGTSFIFSDRAVLGTLEGDPRFFFDDNQTPQGQGTGTEEWGGGGDYWGGLNMTLPFAGHPVGARNPQAAKNDEDKIESAYRFLLADAMPFGKNALIRLEHGERNNLPEHYQTVTYWYGAPAATLVKTDELKLGDAASEGAHRYISPQASAPYAITSRYEWGVDSMETSYLPASQPSDFAEFEFEAAANKTYYIWVRGENLDGKNTSDAAWLQFDEEIGTSKLGPTYSHLMGFGNWGDRFPKGTYAWSSALPSEPPQTIRFAKGGRHKLRIQPRQPGHQIESIWLSGTQKTLPDILTLPHSSAEEIVLRANDAMNLHGQVQLVADARTEAGKSLRMGGKPGKTEVYPAHTDQGRKTKGTSEFALRLDPKNFGVMLRRKLDYSFPNQRAEVFIADDGKQPKESDWKPAGTWYLAGANTCVYSNPSAELGATEHIVQTSNRRFRDDEFLLPRELTQGRKSIRVRVIFTPVERPLFPGQPIPELAWSEIRYDAYCFVMPDWKP